MLDYAEILKICFNNKLESGIDWLYYRLYSVLFQIESRNEVENYFISTFYLKSVQYKLQQKPKQKPYTVEHYLKKARISHKKRVDPLTFTY